MNKKTWEAFTVARDQYRAAVEELAEKLPRLRRIQQKLVNHRGGPSYPVETAVVYNRTLDETNPGDDIKLILVADNPGRREQAAENRRYLVGPSGKIAEKFFRDNPMLGIDFRKNVLILNKTPIHTPRTAELRELCRLGGPALEAAVRDSQLIMVRILGIFCRCLKKAPVWIIGYSEMKQGGIFEPYTNALRELAASKTGNGPLRERIFFYRHFSMNQFTIDLRRQALPEETVQETLERIGATYRERVLGKPV
jgi:hypothetical protein